MEPQSQRGAPNIVSCYKAEELEFQSPLDVQVLEDYLYQLAHRGYGELVNFYLYNIVLLGKASLVFSTIVAYGQCCKVHMKERECVCKVHMKERVLGIVSVS